MAKPTYALYVDDALKLRDADRVRMEGEFDKLAEAGGFTTTARLVKEITIDEAQQGIVRTVRRRKRGETKAKKPSEQKK